MFLLIAPIADDLSDNSDTEDTSLDIPINLNTKKRKADPLATISGMTVKPQAGKQGQFYQISIMV